MPPEFFAHSVLLFSALSVAWTEHDFSLMQYFHNIAHERCNWLETPAKTTGWVSKHCSDRLHHTSLRMHDGVNGHRCSGNLKEVSIHAESLSTIMSVRDKITQYIATHDVDAWQCTRRNKEMPLTSHPWIIYKFTSTSHFQLKHSQKLGQTWTCRQKASSFLLGGISE